MTQYRLKYMPFPAEAQGVYGFISGAGRFPLIVIDSNQDADTQRHALRHELAHLALKHLDSSAPLAEIEAEADAYAGRMTDAEFARLMEWQITA